jgi:outer membrane lipoprotein carrier protein
MMTFIMRQTKVLSVPMMRAVVLAGVLVLTGLGLGQAGAATVVSAQDQLRSFVGQVKTATGSFLQSTVGPQGQTRPAQSGQFSFQRPGRFKWDVVSPYAQQIVSDGKEVFQLDPDLNQVTVRQVNQAIGASPAAVLFGSVPLEQAFIVSPLPDRDGIAWLRAKPRDGAAGFVHLDLGMRDGLPVRVILLDAFGQTTRVELSGMVRNPDLQASTFEFVAPAGADVVRMQ